MKIDVSLNHQTTHDPLNLAGLEIELNYDQDDPNTQVSLNEFEFGVGKRGDDSDGATLLNRHKDNGLTGDVGVFEMPILTIRVSDSGRSYDLFNGGLDLSTALFDCNLVTAKGIEGGRIDWLNENAGFSMDYLFEGLTTGQAGKISTEDLISIPYVISSIPNWREVAITTLSAFVMANEIKDSLQSLIDYVATLPDILMAGQVIAIRLRITYIVLLVIAMVKFMVELFNLIIQPVKYHGGMNVFKQCQRGAEFLGLEFRSSILETAFKDLVLLPEKYAQIENEDKNNILGFLNKDKSEKSGVYKGTFGELLIQLKLIFNAKIIFDGDVMRLERNDYTTASPLYQIPAVDQSSYSLNAEDFNSNILINFSTDINDRNTINEYFGTAIQVQTVPKIIANRSLTLLKGLEQNSIQFSLGKMKVNLTFPEKVFDKFFKAIDVVLGLIVKVVNFIIKIVNYVIKAINKILKSLKAIGIKIKLNLKPVQPVQLPSFGNIIEDRIGMLKMETDFVSVPKLLMISEKSDARNNVLLDSNHTKLHAQYLWENYHSIKSFDSDTYPNNSQEIKYSVDNVDFCFEDYEKVRENNVVIAPNGIDKGRLISLKWNPDERTASMSYRVKTPYTKNLKTVKIVPNGF